MGLSELLNQAKWFLPELALVVAGLVILAIELTRWKWKHGAGIVVTLLALLTAMAVLAWELHAGVSQTVCAGAYLLTPLGNLGKLLLLVIGFLTVLASIRYTRIHDINVAEYLYLLLASVLGMFILLSANDFILLFLGLEFLSFPIYVLTGIKVKNERSCEAGLKYIVMGSFSSAILLFGLALIYGATATTNLTEFTQVTLVQTRDNALYLGMVFFLVGLCFKLSLVPFHAWTPDVYEGAPTPVTAFMSVAIKVAVFFVFLRVFANLYHPLLLQGLAIFAILSIVVGNFYALIQTNLKRLIGYSSIAHAGYIMLAFLDPNRAQGSYAMVFYLVNYAFMNLAALFVLVYLTTKEKYVENLSDIQGIGWRQPLLGLTMVVAMFSLAGLPPTPGFLAKFYVFKSAVMGGYIGLVIVALLSTLVSLYYYIKILAMMYMADSCVLAETKERNLPLAFTMLIAVLALFYIGIFPDHLLGALGLLGR